MEYSYIWFKQELLDMLNALGYVHFYTKEQVVDGFEDGKAFYFCESTKTYGYVPCVPYSEIKKIKQNEEHLRILLLKD